MEAATLSQKKKVNKGKLKKTIKNVICRPDPVFWPIVSDEHKKLLTTSLIKYRIPIPEFKKLHWNELKSIPKEKRPKSPKRQKIDGFLFGISECKNALQNNQCSAVILEANVNPKLILQPILDTCIASQIPVICLPDLRKICAEYFAIPTSCLCLKKDCVADFTNEVMKITNSYTAPSLDNDVQMQDISKNENNVTSNNEIPKSTVNKCPYLYRTDKKSRVFIPSEGIVTKISKDFTGQNFIEFSNKTKGKSSNKYMKMMLKRISSNPNRVKGKQN
ncbi:uncharacterized protein ACR2FA_000182 [Aphomia sociella]